MKDHRFSQLELILLVIVILALAVGVILPLLSRRKERSHRPRCDGKLKQMGLALLGYSGDYGGFFPTTPVGNDFSALDENHTNDLPNSKVYWCPNSITLTTMASNSDYWYVGSGLRDDKVDSDQVRLAFDRSGNHPKNGWMNALFSDGHVEGAKPDGKQGWNDNDPASVLDFPYGKMVPELSRSRAGGVNL